MQMQGTGVVTRGATLVGAKKLPLLQLTPV